MEPIEKKEKNINESDNPLDPAGDSNPISDPESSGVGVNASTMDQIEEGFSLQKELDAKTEECQVLNDKYLRLAAEFENYKRRAQREQSDTVRFANEKILKDLLPTIDNLERAIQSGQGAQNNLQALLEGVELTVKQFMETLSKFGVTQISSVGEAFDPTKHQAVANVESPAVPEQHVVDEYQKGYFLQDRILRPAMVTVSSGNPEGSATQQE